MPKDDRIDKSGYYVEMGVVTKNGLKSGIVSVIICFVVMFVLFSFMGAVTDNVLQNVNLNNISEINRGAWDNSINDIHTTTHPNLLVIIAISLFCGGFSILFGSKLEIEFRMNYLKEKYNCKNWDATCNHLQSLGMTYPWWSNDLFWKESCDYRSCSKINKDGVKEPLDKSEFDPTWGQL